LIKAGQHSHIPKHSGPPLENVEPLTAQVFHALGKMVHLNRLLTARMLAQRGVQPADAFALTFLNDNDGISQKDLADFLHLSRPRISMILRNLETSGALVRRPDERDRRLARVFITAEGRLREKESRAIFEDSINKTIGALCEADRRELVRLLGELAERTRDLLREGPQGEDVPAR
jgi:DNA-binding MarR family transcriptional regulator